MIWQGDHVRAAEITEGDIVVEKELTHGTEGTYSDVAVPHERGRPTQIEEL